ncbi:MAG: hypothetical protein KDA84_19640 [Planctomycetaceae bacterium]|nr:hypothetical protein [Planctomycetaceae bacterium]
MTEKRKIGSTMLRHSVGPRTRFLIDPHNRQSDVLTMRQHGTTTTR